MISRGVEAVLENRLPSSDSPHEAAVAAFAEVCGELAGGLDLDEWVVTNRTSPVVGRWSWRACHESVDGDPCHHTGAVFAIPHWEGDDHSGKPRDVIWLKFGSDKANEFEHELGRRQLCRVEADETVMVDGSDIMTPHEVHWRILDGVEGVRTTLAAVVGNEVAEAWLQARLAELRTTLNDPQFGVEPEPDEEDDGFPPDYPDDDEEVSGGRREGVEYQPCAYDEGDLS